MGKFKVKGGFSCDRQSKYDFSASTVCYLSKQYPNRDISVVFKEFDENGNLVDFDSAESSTVSSSDLVMYFNNQPYIIELKERWGRYDSNCYGKDTDNEGWMLNIEKQQSLTNQNWAIPLYVNLYPDGVVRLWNLNKVNNYNTINKDIPTYSVIESNKKNQNRYEVWNRDSTAFKRLKGQPSNGVWHS